MRAAAEARAFEVIVLECALEAAFESFACVRAVVKNRKSAKEKMW